MRNLCLLQAHLVSILSNTIGCAQHTLLYMLFHRIHPVENFTVREKLRFKTGYALRTLQKILIRNTDARLFCCFIIFLNVRIYG